jgi:hypothetical protein
MKRVVAGLVIVGISAVAFALASDSGTEAKGVEVSKRAVSTRAAPSLQTTVPLKEAKLNIEHNATDGDTGFQAFIDGEGWTRLDVKGPDGNVLTIQAKGELRELGLNELFFETVEPENADVPIAELLEFLPEGNYRISGPTVGEDEDGGGRTSGVALLTHDIPAGPVLLTPADGSTVGTSNVVMSWNPVTQTIDGGPVTIIAYQLIVEKDGPTHPHMIGVFGLSMYLPPNVTSIALPNGFLQANTGYAWEVLAIEASGNQTLSSAEFETN